MSDSLEDRNEEYEERFRKNAQEFAEQFLDSMTPATQRVMECERSTNVAVLAWAHAELEIKPLRRDPDASSEAIFAAARKSRAAEYEMIDSVRAWGRAQAELLKEGQ